ncbi:alpha-L-rhamnosidase [Gaoshiqia sp. Z1-71]|uniref:alpha-L-rhamnosidase n=1 Tax=Gaoshiqia hydrogeniformans TaxID=3290090 RepID=UPI003BF793E2
MNLNRLFLFVFVLVAALSSVSCRHETNDNGLPTELKADYTVNPLGIDNPAPLLSWRLNDERMGARQTAFQVLVASSPGLLSDDQADLWNSGKQESPVSRIPYQGLSLQSCKRYYWTVKVWDHEGNASSFSEPGTFETAYLDPSEWKGQWITNTDDTASQPAPYFRKEIRTRSGLVRATAYVAGLGYHELYVNDQKAGNSFLEPGYTRFDRRTLYLTYDITGMLTDGGNGIGVILGNGWYNVQSKAVWYFEKAPWRKSPRLLMDIRLEYNDGSVEFISTDEDWKCSEGPLRFNSLYAGEIYDARLDLGNWSLAGYDDSGWSPVLLTESPGGVLSPQTAPSIKIVRSLKPVKVHTLSPGSYVFDLGENFAGTARLKIKGETGTKVTMQFGEQANEDHSVAMEIIARHMRIAKDALPFQTDIYYLKGGEAEEYTPRFTYHGYRYVQLNTEPAVDLSEIEIEGLFLNTGFEKTGDFRCSNELFNKLYQATMNSYLSNFHSIPTDCPHREKNGWTGDAHIASELGLWNFNGMMPYRKWLQDLRDEQRPTGELPGIVPTSGWGYHWGNGPAWDSALPVIAQTLYEYYGDTTVLAENYDAVKRYVDYLVTRADHGIQHIGLGDWVSLTKTPVEVTSTGYYYYDALTLSKMAGILGKTADREKYAALAEEIKTAFNDRFLDPETNRYRVQTQTALSCALFQGLAPEQAVENTVNDLIASINEKNDHPDFGLLGSKYVLNVLREHGKHELAYKMINQKDFPSWGLWIELGATALWEDWDGREGSQNHIFLGDFSTWFFKALGGIQIDPANPGFSHFRLNPVFPDEISFVETSHKCLHGTIVSNWKRAENKVEMNVVIPPNTTSELTVPDGYQLKNRTDTKGRNIDFGSESNVVKLVSGQYNLVLEKTKR